MPKNDSQKGSVAIGCAVLLLLLLLLGPCIRCDSSSSHSSSGGTRIVASDHSADVSQHANEIGEVAAAEREVEGWAQTEKDALLNELLLPCTERRKSARHRKREEEDRVYEAAERAEASRNAAALEAAERMERRMKEMGLASERQEDELRTFALKEAPHIWQTIQYLRAEVGVQDTRINQIKITCRDGGVPYKDDPDFRNACMLRNKLVRSLRNVEDHLVTALVAQREYAATPREGEFNRAMKKALEDGVLEADLVRKQYEDMKNGQ